MSKTIPERLEESIRLFAAYEEQIWPDQYEEALSAVRDLQAALAETDTPARPIECNFMNTTPATNLVTWMVDVAFAREKADNVRLVLAAYQPYGRSKALRHLRERQYLVDELRRLAKAGAKVLPSSVATSAE